jgi:hypothetical protein
MMNLFCKWIPSATILLALALPLAAAETAPAAATAETVILDAGGSFVRWMSVQRPAVFAAEAGAAERTALDGKRKLDAQAAARVTSDLPAGWTGPAFDDGAWPRTLPTRLPDLAFLSGDGDPGGLVGPGPEVGLFDLGVLAVRAKFVVSDSAAALTLVLKYRGGVVVYLNGQEIARGGLPAGALTPGTPGEPYPAEAYVDAAGKLLPYASRVKENEKERVEARNRTLGPVALPSQALRKGTNVLAIEVHRSDYHASAAGFLRAGMRAPWTPGALVDLRLTAAGAGAEPNRARPAGVQVWNQDASDRTSAQDYGDPAEPLRPIRLTGARNGVFGGKVVVSSDRPIAGLQAVAGALQGAGGKGTIPAAAVEVRYTEPLNPEGGWAEPLSRTPPATVAPTKKGGAVAPVWIWVRVPADAPAGDYTGALTVSAGGAKLADVPVQLHVADWTLPEPRRFRTFVGFYQSPATLSLQYNVPEWSDRHWALEERSLQLMGALGNQLIHIPVVDQTKLGNDDGMVTWIRKDDGAFDYDFAVLDRFLALVKQHMGAPRFVVLHVYQAGGWTPAGAKQENTVTVLDPKSGQRSHLQVPEFGTEASKQFWTPALTALRGRLAQAGMEQALCLGSLCETFPTTPEAKMFADILGSDVSWFRQGHPSQGRVETPEPITGGGRVGLHYFTYLPSLPDPDAGVPSLHQTYWPRTAYFRAVTDPAKPLLLFRSYAATARFLQLPGFGYLGLDYWNVGIKKNGEDRRPYVWGRWPRASNYPGALSPQYVTWPGPDGAEPVTSYQALREGLQETEALIVLSEALNKSADKLGAELAGRCRTALRDELLFCRDRGMQRWAYTYYQANHYGREELTRRLFTLAGEVSAAVR